MSESEVLTPEDVARRWKMTPQTVINKIKNGELEGAYRFGKLYRIPLDVIEEYEKLHIIQSEAK